MNEKEIIERLLKNSKVDPRFKEILILKQLLQAYKDKEDNAISHLQESLHILEDEDREIPLLISNVKDRYLKPVLQILNEGKENKMKQCINPKGESGICYAFDRHGDRTGCLGCECYTKEMFNKKDPLPGLKIQLDKEMLEIIGGEK